MNLVHQSEEQEVVGEELSNLGIRGDSQGYEDDVFSDHDVERDVDEKETKNF